MDESQPDATRAFSLLRKLAEGGKQSAEETHELIELIEAMASANLVSQLGAKIDILTAQLSSMEKNQNAQLSSMEKNQNAKIDTQTAQLSSMEKNQNAQLSSMEENQNAKIETLAAKYTVVIWAITFAGLVLGAAIIFGG